MTTNWTYNGESIICDDKGDIAQILNGSDSDGHLMAAAPDLLAACQHVLSVLENPPPNKPGGVSRTILREAIARATAK
jgi:hypothetical protein